MTQKSLTQQRDELKRKLEQLEKKQAKLEEDFSKFSQIMSIILDEADGVQSGAAPTIPNQPKSGYCM